MQKIKDIIIKPLILLGIILELGKVFYFLFMLLDEDNKFFAVVGSGTFSLASLLFVMETEKLTVKRLMIFLDVTVILFYYLIYNLFEFRVEYASIPIALYTGMIIFYFGKSVSKSITDGIDTETETLRTENETLTEKLNALSERNRILETRFRLENERRELENRLERAERSAKECKTPALKEQREKECEELKIKLNVLNAKIV